MSVFYLNFFPACFPDILPGHKKTAKILSIERFNTLFGIPLHKTVRVQQFTKHNYTLQSFSLCL